MWPYHNPNQTLPKKSKVRTCQFPDCNRVALYMNHRFKMCDKHKEFLSNDYARNNAIEHIMRGIKGD
jgi:hypothetical protein